MSQTLRAPLDPQVHVDHMAEQTAQQPGPTPDLLFFGHHSKIRKWAGTTEPDEEYVSPKI